MCTGRLSLTRSPRALEAVAAGLEPGEEVGGHVLDLALLEHRDPDPPLAEHRTPAPEQLLVVEPVEVLERGEEARCGSIRDFTWSNGHFTCWLYQDISQ